MDLYLARMNDIFEFIEKRTSANKFAIQARGSKRQNMSQKQKNMAQNLFPNECKAVIQVVDFKAKIKTQIPENCP